jgi:hypothetical protein
MNTYTRIPKKVLAVQWYPSMKLNYVENVMGEVVSATASTYMGASYNPNDPFQPPQKPRMACIGGRVKCGDKVFDLEPSDFVIYDIDTGFPIQVLNESTFLNAYTLSQNLELCSVCMEKVVGLNGSKSPTPKSIEDCIALLERGEPLDLGNGKVIRTIAEFKKWAAENGKIL